MEVPTLLKKVIQTDGLFYECVQGEVIVSTHQHHLDLFAQSSSEYDVERRLNPSAGFRTSQRSGRTLQRSRHTAIVGVGSHLPLSG